MRAKQKILDLLKDGLAYKGLDNLFSFIVNTYNFSREEVERDFDKLISEGQIFEVGKDKYIKIPATGYARGWFIGNSKGFGFCQIDGDDEGDIFIPANQTNGAIDGDGVIIRILSQSEEGKDGQIVSIFKPVELVTGVIQKIGKNYFVEPDNNHIPFKIRVIDNGQKFEIGDRVVVNMDREKDSLVGQVVEMLGVN